MSVAGCEKTFENMYHQPKYKPLAASPLWPDGRASRPPVADTVVRSEGSVAGTSSGRLGLIAGAGAFGGDNATHANSRGDDWTLATLQRGRERYDIYCAPCHSEVGDGDGMIVRRGFPRPGSFHTDRLRAASDAYFDGVITRGIGAMYSYADRLSTSDRHAVIAYIRALQLSQDAKLDDVPTERRGALEAAR
jgi:cytochrome c553